MKTTTQEQLDAMRARGHISINNRRKMQRGAAALRDLLAWVVIVAAAFAVKHFLA